VPPEFTLSASVSLPAQRSSSTESCPVPWSVADGSGGAKWRTVWSDVEDPVEESGGEEWRTGVNCSRPGTVNQTAVRSVVRPAHCFHRPYAGGKTFPTPPWGRAPMDTETPG